MKIEELHLIGFGRFHNYKISFEDGLNLIYGENEAGKTTIQHFIVGMLYGFFVPGARRKTYSAEYSQYQPWNSAISYEGAMICSKDGRRYRIQRVFQKENESVSVFDADTGEDLSSQFPYDPLTRLRTPGLILAGVSKTIFCNTARIAHLETAPQEDFAKAWEDQVLSLSETADSSLSLQRVQTILDKKADEIGSPKRKKTPFGQSIDRLEELKREEERLDESNHSHSALYQRKDELEQCRQSIANDLAQIDQKLQNMGDPQSAAQYEKALQIKDRIEQLAGVLERTQEREEPHDLQRQIGACEQAKQMLDQEEASFAQWDARLKDINERFTAQPIRTQDLNLLNQCFALKEKAMAHPAGQSSQHLRWEIQQKQQELTELSSTDLGAIGEALVEYDAWQEELDKQAGPSKWIVLALGGFLAVGGSALGIFSSPFWFIAAVLGCITAAGSLFIGNRGAVLEEAEEGQSSILARFHQKDRDGLEALHAQAQIQSERRAHLIDELRVLTQQLQSGAPANTVSGSELDEYAVRITGNPQSRWSNQLVEQVQTARELCLEFAEMSKQRTAEWEQLRRHRQEYQSMQKSLQETLESMGISENNSAELEKFRVEQQERARAQMELELQQKQLLDCLDGKSFEELQQQYQKHPALDNLNESREALEAERAELGEKEQVLIRELSQIEGQLSTMEQYHRPMGDVRKEREALEEQCVQWQQTLDAIQLAKEKLAQASASIQKDLSPALARRMSEIISWLTSGRYSKVLLSRDLHIRLEDPQTGRLICVESLSRGTMDLIYLAMRMELVTVLCEKTNLPLLMDDSFNHLDDQRASGLLLYLSQHLPGQALIFTCQHREEQILRQNELAAHIITLSRE